MNYLSGKKQEFSFLYVDVKIEAVEQAQDVINKLKQDLKTYEESRSDFESRMIVVFSIVLSMLGFVFMTFSSSFETVDSIFRFAGLYLFVISSFVCLIRSVFQAGTKINWKSYIVPGICIVLSAILFILY